MALLSRYTGEEDICVGAPTANRSSAKTEGLIGFFVNMLALRGDLSGDPTYRELLNRTRENALGAFNHQELPFEMMVKALQPERDASRNPIFQVAFQHQNVNIGARELRLPKLRLKGMETDFGTAKLDLMLSVSEGKGNAIHGSFRYNTDLFEEETIQRMSEHFNRLISGMVTNPDQPISTIPMLSETEREKLLVAWNPAERSVPHDQGIHQIIEAQVKKTPDVVALSLDEEKWTYERMNREANQLAQTLVSSGVDVGDVVGLCLERSAEMIVALLGILKAGGQLLPLDPSYPEERLAFMIEDSGANTLVTQTRLLKLLPGFAGKAIQLDLESDEIQSQPGENLEIPVIGEDTAYLIYTSGTTGRPKGVSVTHHNLINHASEMADVYGLATGERILQYISISFDAAFEEIFPVLLRGGTIVVAEKPAEFVGTSLLNLIREKEIQYMHLPVSVWHQTVIEMERLDLKVPECLRLVLVGGEQVDFYRFKVWSERVTKPMRFVNAYGPTETTITATLFETQCSPETVGEMARIPIGKPLSNVKVYVLDRNKQPVPVGIPGELYIGGAGVARGYLNRPKLNESVFVADPFQVEPEAIMYRTGDMVRYLRDGNLEFLGRVDQQVKLRGYRIELDEICHQLQTHERVDQAIVMLREDVPGLKQLVAYLSGKDGELDNEALSNHLQKRLPMYMVPSAYIWLDSIPTLPNGKIDRNALPVPELDGTAGYIAPRTALEERLTEMWQELLGVEEISVTANFFDLGGNSLLGATFVNRLQEALGEYLYLIAIFDAPTIASLATYLQENYPVGVLRLMGEEVPEGIDEEGQRAKSPERFLKMEQKQPLVPIQPRGSKPPLFLAHAAGGMVFPYYNLIPYMPDQPIYGLQDPSSYHEEIFYQSLEEMAEDYVQWMQKVQPNGPYRLAGWSFGGILAFEMAQNLTRKGEEVSMLMPIDTGIKPPDFDKVREEIRARRNSRNRVFRLKTMLTRISRIISSLWEAVIDVIPYIRSGLYALLSRNLTGEDKKKRFSQIFDRIRGMALTSEFLKGSDLAELADQEKHLLNLNIPSSMGRVLQLIPVHQRFANNYNPTPFPGKIYVVRSDQRKDDKVEPGFGSETLGWEYFAEKGAELIWTQGSHTSLFKDPDVKELVKILEKLLSEN
jgi:amino acid adenylation domain-containing protein